MKKTFFLSAVCFLLFCSCEHNYDYSYTVVNKSDTIIVVQYKTNEILDSTVAIAKDESRLLFITDHGVEKRKGPFFHDVKEDLISFSVKKNGVESNRNFLSNDPWDYSVGDYQAEVTNAEF